MDQYVTGAIIRQLREKNRLTQAQLAERLHVSDKTVSKWETARGYPDISLLEPIADTFGISVAELISGSEISNSNRAANVLKSVFYVCPVCGNILCAMGEAAVHCHGVMLAPCEAEAPDEAHPIRVETVEDEYYVQIGHEMTKSHHISFIAAVTPDSVRLVKLYPEGDAGARFKKSGVMKLCYYCNRDGLFALDLRRKPRTP